MDIHNITHPLVELPWNFFPIDFFIWAPAKWFLNFIFLPFWLPSIQVYELFNIIPYTFMMIIWLLSTIAVITLFMVLVALSGVWVFITILYAYALPDQVTVPIILTIVGSIVAGIVAGVYAIIGYEQCKTLAPEYCFFSSSYIGKT